MQYTILFSLALALTPSVTGIPIPFPETQGLSTRTAAAGNQFDSALLPREADAAAILETRKAKWANIKVKISKNLESGKFKQNEELVTEELGQKALYGLEKHPATSSVDGTARTLKTISLLGFPIKKDARPQER